MADSGFISDRRGRARVARAGADRRPGARVRGAVLRRLRQPGAARSNIKQRRHGRRLHDARPAPAADRAGCRPRRADPRRRDPRQAQAAAGRRRRCSRSIRAPARSWRMVGGRSYNQSQYNRAISVPAAARARSSSRSSTWPRSSARRTRAGPTSPPATVIARRADDLRSSTTSRGPRATTTDEFDGPVTLRRALALSRNIVAVKVAEAAGYDSVAALWRKFGAGTPPRPYPSIALGVFEATPFEIASAYTIFPNGGHRSGRSSRHPAARAAAARISRSQARRSKDGRPARTRPSS